MKMDVHGRQGERVELEIARPMSPNDKWVFTYTFPNKFATIIRLDRYELKAMLAVLIGSL